MIIVTQTFEKILKKLGKQLDIVTQEIHKYKKNSTTYISLWEYVTSAGNIFLIAKDYIDHRKMRLIVLIRIRDDIYVPVSLVAKDSEKGYNITKENVKDLFETNIRKSMEDIEKGKYKKIG